MIVISFYFEGPLTYTKNGKTTLYGIVSFGIPLILNDSTIPIKVAQPDEGMYTRVATPDIITWIKDFMKKSEKD